ncbi:hypothetical protein KFK09_028541 [Dendrobium nobile]|uniref:Uncharacterized protein n=1 Tax=Dendrobium nobile TaxID=94219 RepID=A0A8T3A3K7_DENNO|nr:hypothetical protein KFK09_028541 [Dendrobium nobile]
MDTRLKKKPNILMEKLTTPGNKASTVREERGKKFQSSELYSKSYSHKEAQRHGDLLAQKWGRRVFFTAKPKRLLRGVYFVFFSTNPPRDRTQREKRKIVQSR